MEDKEQLLEDLSSTANIHTSALPLRESLMLRRMQSTPAPHCSFQSTPPSTPSTTQSVKPIIRSSSNSQQPVGCLHVARRHRSQTSHRNSFRISMDSDPGILMMEQSAHTLPPQYKYHAFILYHPTDRQAALGLVKRLESAPYHYRCCYDLRDFYRNTSDTQNVVCASMLSERVLLCLSVAFLNDLWPQYEATLAHMTSLTQRRQRLVPLLMMTSINADAAPLPECFRGVPVIDAKKPKYWEAIVSTMRCSTLLKGSDSTATLSSILSCQSVLAHCNGQLVCRIKVKFVGVLYPKLQLDITANPSRVRCLPRLNLDSIVGGLFPVSQLRTGTTRILTEQPITLQTSTTEDNKIRPFCDNKDKDGDTEDEDEDPLNKSDVDILVESLQLDDLASSWELGDLPSILIIVFGVLWCISLGLVIGLYPENSPATLPVRLSVFLFPGVLIVTFSILRWKRINQLKNKKACDLLHRTIRVNAAFFVADKDFLITSVRNSKSDTINEHIKLFLCYYKESEKEKLNRLVDLYTGKSFTDKSFCLSIRLALSLSSAYSRQLVSKYSPQPLEQRHTRRRQCLCQFIEDFVSTYLPLTHRDSSCGLMPLRCFLLRYLDYELNLNEEQLKLLGLEGQNSLFNG